MVCDKYVDASNSNSNAYINECFTFRTICLISDATRSIRRRAPGVRYNFSSEQHEYEYEHEDSMGIYNDVIVGRRDRVSCRLYWDATRFVVSQYIETNNSIQHNANDERLNGN